MFVRGDAVRLPFADKTFDLCVGSPPYLEARLYLEDGEDKEIARGCFSWVKWMLRVTIEALRVTKGPVIWVVAGTTKDYNYQPGPEGLLWEWWKRGGDCHCLRPTYWYRSGIPGSGGDQGYRNDVEYCLWFKRPGKMPYANPKANGHRPKFLDVQGRPMNDIGQAMQLFDGDGGEMCVSSRRKPRNNMGGALCTTGKDGRIVPRKPTKNGNRICKETGEFQQYNEPVIANPGNLLKTINGGGNLGHQMAHQNEAPYHIDVPKFFINSHCPPGGLVLDPFSGSGTTVHAAVELGRRGVGLDLRHSQCLLSRKRVRTVTPGFQFSE